MNDDATFRYAADQLRAFVERVEKLEAEVKIINDDKRDVYGEAKANGIDVKALKAVIAYRRKDPAEREELDAVVETYLHSLGHLKDTGTPVATRAPARAGSASPETSTAAPQARPQ